MAEPPSDLDPTTKEAVERLVAEQGSRAVLDLVQRAMAARASSFVEDLKTARPAPLRRARSVCADDEFMREIATDVVVSGGRTPDQTADDVAALIGNRRRAATRP